MTFHETILNKLLEYREAHPNFNFIARQRTGKAKRLEGGFWFPGNEKYAFVGLINANGGSKKTKSVGISISPTSNGFSCDLEIAFSEEKDALLIEGYHSLVQNISGIRHDGGTNYHSHIGELTVDDFSNLFTFFDTYYDSIVDEFKKRDRDSVLISTEKFEDILNKINGYRMDISDKKYWLYSAGNNGDEWENFYADGLMGLGWGGLGDLSKYSSKDEIVLALKELYKTEGSKKNDATTNYNFIAEMKIGDIIFVKKGTSNLLGYGVVDSDYKFEPNADRFKHIRSVQWKNKGNWVSGKKMPRKTLTNITDEPSPESTSKSYPEYLMAIINGRESQKPNANAMKNSLNTILYGPPGTGKTYNTKNLALKILGVELENLTREEINETYEKKVEDGQIVFTTFHQSMSYEDFIEGIKPVTTTAGKIQYEVEPGIFLKTSKVAEDNYLDSKTGRIKELAFDQAFAKLKEEWEENEDIKFSMKSDGYDFTILGFTEKSIRFKKSSGTSNHTLSIKTLRDGYYGNKEIRDTGVGIYYPGILKRMKGYKLESSSISKSLNNYILIIDEINRGNVSAIFGELITLIEKDKRLGADEALMVQLPYSKEQFGVPPNLYIIATMNTADRSVEALDSALRRRFSFTEMPSIPSYVAEHGSLENGIIDDIDLVELLRTLNKRIEKLLDKDHTIGHSYFLKIKNVEDLKAVIANKVIPLLQEYFFGDYGKIGLVMGNGFVDYDATDTDEEFFAPFEYEIGSLLGRKVYKINDALKMEDVEFKGALRKLIG